MIPQGPKLYFPNFIFTLVRSGKQRSPNEVVFRVPRILNKLDIKQYLERLYGLQVRDIRTVNFLPKVTRQGRHYVPGRKNAIVRLGEKFTWPLMTDAKLLKYPLAETNKYPKLH
jgi:large subunit ribosomal protein L23